MKVYWIGVIISVSLFIVIYASFPLGTQLLMKLEDKYPGFYDKLYVVLLVAFAVMFNIFIWSY
jgi:hypothetical protein